MDYRRARPGWSSAQASPRLRIGRAPRCSHCLIEPKGCSTAISRVGVPFGEFAVVGVTHTLRARRSTEEAPHPARHDMPGTLSPKVKRWGIEKCQRMTIEERWRETTSCNAQSAAKFLRSTPSGRPWMRDAGHWQSNFPQVSTRWESAIGPCSWPPRGSSRATRTTSARFGTITAPSAPNGSSPHWLARTEQCCEGKKSWTIEPLSALTGGEADKLVSGLAGLDAICQPDAAWSELQDALRAGDIVARGTPPETGIQQNISPDDWSDFIGWRMTGRNLITASSTTPTAFDTATLVLKAKP